MRSMHDAFRILIPVSMIAAIGIAGCGSGPKPPDSPPDTRPVTKVSGQFTANGQNINGAGLAAGFQPVEGGIYRAINLSADGSFAGDAIVGKNRVFLIAVGNTTLGHGENASPIQTGYMSPDSPLTADVNAGGENKFNFDVGVPIPDAGGQSSP